MSVVHQVRGRLRVRVPSTARVDGLVEAVLAMPGVRAASFSPRTRGLLVLHDESGTAAILETIARHAGVERFADRPPLAASAAPPTLAATTSAVFGQIDARVSRATRGLVTLGSLVPLVLTVWAGRELLLGRAAPLAWSSALWYAHGLFRDYTLAPRDD